MQETKLLELNIRLHLASPTIKMMRANSSVRIFLGILQVSFVYSGRAFHSSLFHILKY